MFSFDFLDDRHAPGTERIALVQPGQPADAVLQRQQSDDLPAYRGDQHGVERELQFADMDCRVRQAQG